MTYYDAEIEYLESDGNQFIDTGFYPNQDTGLKAELAFGTFNSWEVILGCREKVDTKEFTIQRANNYGRLRALYGQARTANQLPNVDTNRFSLNWNKRVITVNNTTHTFASQTFTVPYTLYLYGLHSSTSEYYKGKFWYCQIYDNDTLVRDFIPVRIGSVGYMYDKVSDRLFGNSGTGSFILGPDVAGWPGVTGKPKVSSIRRQMIQLMPKKLSVYDGMGTKNLYFHLSGQDAPVNGKWVDRIRNSQWTLTGVTHTDDYYYFNSRKPSSGAADVWASCSNLYSNFDLGEQWAMEIDIEFTSDTTSGQIVDFNSVTGVSAGRCGISAGFWQTTTGKASATMQVKPNGNDIVTWATDLSLNLESQEGEWSNAKLIVLCKKVNDTQSQLLIYSNGVLNRQSDLFTAVRYNRFDGTAFLGRAITNGGNYKYQITPFRLKDFKIYTFI